MKGPFDMPLEHRRRSRDLMYDAGLDYDLLARFRDDYLDRKTRCTTVDYAIANEGVRIYG